MGVAGGRRDQPVAYGLRSHFARGRLQRGVPDRGKAPVPDELRSAVARLLQAGGDLTRLGSSRAFTRKGLASQAPYAPGDLARATLLTVARSPRVFAAPGRKVADVPYASMYPILEEVPHYLQWIGAQGFLGTIPPSCAIVAADLARRVRWRRLGVRRGAGRLLWMFEQMATPLHADVAVPHHVASCQRARPGKPRLAHKRQAGPVPARRQRIRHAAAGSRHRLNA